MPVHLHQLCMLKLSAPHHVLCVFWGVYSEWMAAEWPLSSTGSLANLSTNETLDLQAMRPALKFTLANRCVQTLALLMETSCLNLSRVVCEETSRGSFGKKHSSCETCAKSACSAARLHPFSSGMQRRE